MPQLDGTPCKGVMGSSKFTAITPFQGAPPNFAGHFGNGPVVLHQTKARTGKVPMPFTFTGTAKKRKPKSEAGPNRAMLHDGTSAPSKMVWTGPRQVAGVVDVQRVDPYKSHACSGKVKSGVLGQERVPLEVPVRAPMRVHPV